MIIDRRKDSNTSSSLHKKRFLDLLKQHINTIKQDFLQSITFDHLAKEKVNIPLPKGTFKQPRLRYDPKRTVIRAVSVGNDRYKVGDKIHLRGTSLGTGGSGGGNDEDELIVSLSPQELADLLFPLELPFYRNTKNKKVTDNIFLRKGYTKYGPRSRLSIKKTFEAAMMRKIALQKQTPYIDDTDLRYFNLSKQEQFTSSAVVFFIMDRSGSLTDHCRYLSKYFFFLFYCLLKKNYGKIECVFILHNEEAREVSEKEFFRCNSYGGTRVDSALKLVNQLIEDTYPPDAYNIYVAQASDGQTNSYDNTYCKKHLRELLPIINYYIYLQFIDLDEYSSFDEEKFEEDSFLEVINELGEKNKHIKGHWASNTTMIVDFFKNVFEN